MGSGWYRRARGWRRMCAALSGGLQQEPVGAGEEGDGEGADGAGGGAVELEGYGAGDGELEVAGPALFDVGMGQVGALCESAAERGALGALESIQMQLGDAVAGMATGHEVVSVAELTVRDHGALNRRRRVSLVERERARPPADALGWGAQHHHVDRDAAVVEAQRVHRDGPAARLSAVVHAEGPGELARGPGHEPDQRAGMPRDGEREVAVAALHLDVGRPGARRAPVLARLHVVMASWRHGAGGTTWLDAST